MEQPNLDFEAFARLRGARGKRGLPKWSAVGAALLLAGLFFTVTGSLRAETELLEPLKSLTSMAISVLTG